MAIPLTVKKLKLIKMVKHIFPNSNINFDIDRFGLIFKEVIIAKKRSEKEIIDRGKSLLVCSFVWLLTRLAR